MKKILIILAALLGIGAFGQTNIPTRQMLADTNGVVKWPTNITSITIGGRTYTNLLGFGLALTNGQLSVDTTQLPAGGGGGGGGSGTVTSVGLSTSLSGLSIGSSPVTSSGTITLSGTLGLGSGGTGATDAPGARTALSLVPGTDVQAYDADLAAIAALANSGIIVRTGSGTVSARTITGDSEAVVSNGDGVSGNPTLSIGSAIARDSEVAASYQPLDADLTAMAAGTAVATAQTNAVSFGAPAQYVGSTNIAQHLALKAPLASPAFTTSATIGGTNVLDYAATHLTEVEASALYQRTNVNLTTVANLTGGTSTNFLAGDGTFKQVSTNHIPGLNAVLATIGGGSGEVNTGSNLGTPSSTVQGLYNSKSGVDLRFRSLEAGSGITITSNANTVAIASTGGTWDGTPIASGTITNLTTESITLSGQVRTNWPGYSLKYVESHTPLLNGFTLATSVDPYHTYIYNSATFVVQPSTSRHPGIYRASTVTAGGSVSLLNAWGNNGDGVQIVGGESFEVVFRVLNTNGLSAVLGFNDAIITPVDSIAIRIGRTAGSWNKLEGVCGWNGTETATSTSYTISTNTWYVASGSISTNISEAFFSLRLFDDNSLLWTNSVFTNIPNGSARLTAVTFNAGYTNSNTPIIDFDSVYAKVVGQ